MVPVVAVVDGDTLRVRVDGRTERVRLIGIDTPELAGDQCFAREAADAMTSLVGARPVRLDSDPTQGNRDKHGRLLRHVVLPDGRLAANVLIAEGYGRVYTKASAQRHHAQYQASEAKARAARLGVWSPRCANSGGGSASSSPRPAQSAAKGTSNEPAANCRIKGNISSKGEKIYHVPGSRSYNRTVITPSKGERWFCTESEARNAGWRAPKG